MRHKQFVIHAESGFREMPILVSASAVQFSFGLDDFLLPDFTHVHIFPEAFIGTYPTLRLLEGNVSGSNVHLSWKHFLNGYQYPENGENAGLHEFAHAYHLQFTESNTRQSGSFEKAFGRFHELADQLCGSESKGVTDLYPANSLRNRDEFWAGTVELFFEKPATLASAFPDLYGTVVTLLRQDPLRGG